MPITISEKNLTPISASEIQTNEDLLYSHPTERISLLYYVQRKNNQTIITSLGSVVFSSPFKEHTMSPYSYYKIESAFQPVTETEPAYIKNNHAYIEKELIDTALQTQDENHPEWDSTETHQYKEVKTHSGTEYIGLPFKILPLLYCGGFYSSLNVSLYTDNNQEYKIEQSVNTHPKLSPCSSVKNEQPKDITELQITDKTINTFEEMPNKMYTSDNPPSKVKSISPVITDINYEYSFEKQRSIELSGFITEDQLNTLLKDDIFLVNYFEPVYGSLYFVYIAEPEPEQLNHYGTKEVLQYLQSKELTILSSSTKDNIKILIQDKSEILKLHELKVSSISLDEEHNGLVCSIDDSLQI
jgi:hypothetical protein